jgi:2-phosphoglycerate kinase
LVLQDEELHRVYLTQRLNGEPGRDGERHLRHFAIIRQLQETLREAAVAADVPIHDVTHPELLTQAIVDRIIAAAVPNPEGRK